MKRVLLLAALSLPVMADDTATPCDQIDPKKVDTDGMPFCPDVVKTNSAYAVFRCAFAQSNSWHPATDPERKSQSTLLDAFTKSVKDGISTANTTVLRTAADQLGLQTCRVRDGADAYLLAYTKPGVRDYSGPFMMLRESKSSKVMIMSPHDGTDGTHADTKMAFQASKARVLLSNGYQKGITENSDFLNNRNALGSIATKQLADIYPGSVWMMIHGMANGKSILYRSRSKALASAYEEGFKAVTDIENYNPKFNAGYQIDRLVNTDFYIKTEIPVKIHKNNPTALGKVIVHIETKPWAWDGAEPLLNDLEDTEPTVLKAEVTAVVDSYKYAPVPQIVAGNKQLVCLGIKYADLDRVASPKDLRIMCDEVDKFWTKNSRKNVTMYTSGFQVDSPLLAKEDNLNAAEKAAMQLHPSKDFHAIVSMFLSGSNSGKGVAHLKGLLYRDAEHEVGHLLGLGHAGAWKFENGAWSLDHYGDPSSVMGRFPAGGITAAQAYSQGWLPEKEAAMYEPGKTYELKKVSDFDGFGLTTVIVKNSDFKGEKAIPLDPKLREDAFISFEGPKLALHLSSGGASHRVSLFDSEYYDTHFTGLHIKKISETKDTVRVSLDFEAKPLPKL